MSNYKIFNFAYFPNYDGSIEYLAETLADKEDWDFSDSKEKKHAILRKYLEYTYRKLDQEKKIIFTNKNKNASFNTGLVTPHYEEIFAFFEKNDIPGAQPYVFKAFYKKSDRKLLNTFDTFPSRANFFQKPELLIFNPQLEIIHNLEHIIEDNKERFPSHLKNNNDTLIRNTFEGAIKDAQKKVAANYKIAVPQYYQNEIQLLLPLCLSGTPNPDLALVTRKVKEKYQATTCLTLKMAYNNARLIVKPESDWLKP